MLWMGGKNLSCCKQWLKFLLKSNWNKYSYNVINAIFLNVWSYPPVQLRYISDIPAEIHNMNINEHFGIMSLQKTLVEEHSHL